MYLKSLEIAGFKSFAKKASLTFNTPITSIVGPNGSGKSNVAEAFRFVLGEQSIKSLRGRRGEDLIFNGGGGGELGKMNRASVRLVFDNTKRMLNIDFDEVVIERVVHRDSTNEYLVNGSQVRLKDVSELLSGAHIGASGHHIISQGEADRILNANIKERREMIEEALGLKIYQYKKEEGKKKLEKTEENMKEVSVQRREIAPHLTFLKKQVEKIEKVRSLRDELGGLYREYFYKEEKYIKAEKESINNDKKAPEGELLALERELVGIRSILESKKMGDRDSEELVKADTLVREVRGRKDRVMHDLGVAEGEIGSLRKSIARERELETKDDHKTVPLRDVEDMSRKIDSLADGSGPTGLTDAQAFFAEVKRIISTLISTYKSTLDTSRIKMLEEELSQLEGKKAGLEKSLTEASNELDTAVAKYDAIKQAIEKEKDTNRDAEKEMFRVIGRQNEIRTYLEKVQTRESVLAHEEEDFKRELQEAYVLVGRPALDFHSFVPAGDATDGQGSADSREAQLERKKKIEKIKIRIEDSGAGNGAETMKEYDEVMQRDQFLAKEMADLETSKASLLELIRDLDARLDQEFREGVAKINAQFQQFFALMFGGGSAGLSLVREKKRARKSFLSLDTEMADAVEDMESADDTKEGELGPEGIDIEVSLPRKKVKGLMMLSGGERALTSIALLFAISQVNPPPFVILDETDAALDEANSRKYGDMVESLSKLSQLILITHNRETMSRAGVLYGVTMGGDGSSRLLSIKFDEAVQVAK